MKPTYRTSRWRHVVVWSVDCRDHPICQKQRNESDCLYNRNTLSNVLAVSTISDKYRNISQWVVCAFWVVALAVESIFRSSQRFMFSQMMPGPRNKVASHVTTFMKIKHSSYTRCKPIRFNGRDRWSKTTQTIFKQHLLKHLKNKERICKYSFFTAKVSLKCSWGTCDAQSSRMGTSLQVPRNSIQRRQDEKHTMSNGGASVQRVCGKIDTVFSRDCWAQEIIRGFIRVDTGGWHRTCSRRMLCIRSFTRREQVAIRLGISTTIHNLVMWWPWAGRKIHSNCKETDSGTGSKLESGFCVLRDQGHWHVGWRLWST